MSAKLSFSIHFFEFQHEHAIDSNTKLHILILTFVVPNLTYYGRQHRRTDGMSKIFFFLLPEYMKRKDERKTETEIFHDNFNLFHIIKYVIPVARITNVKMISNFQKKKTPKTADLYSITLAYFKFLIKTFVLSQTLSRPKHKSIHIIHLLYL